MKTRIVLAEDEVHIRRAAELKLQREFDVTVAENGQEAWERIQESCPDLLITDVQMPLMDGIELIENVRANESTMNLPVILLTGKSFELAKDEAFKSLNICKLMSKPFSPRELLAAAKHATGNSDDSEVTRKT